MGDVFQHANIEAYQTLSSFIVQKAWDLHTLLCFWQCPIANELTADHGKPGQG